MSLQNLIAQDTLNFGETNQIH